MRSKNKYSNRFSRKYKRKPSGAQGHSDSLRYESLESRQLLASNILSTSPDGQWTGLDPVVLNSVNGTRLQKFTSFSVYDLQEQTLGQSLAKAPLEFTDNAFNNSISISVPRPDKSYSRFSIVEAPVMEPALAAQFPEIKTYRGFGIDDPSSSIRFDVTPHGFHAQVLSPYGDYYVDPIFHGKTDYYASYFVADAIQTGEDFHEEDLDLSNLDSMGPFSRSVPTADGTGWSSPANPGGWSPLMFGTELRTFRLAVAATGEYTAFHGGTVALGQAAIVTAVNRVTGVYEKDLAIRMVLIANNSSIVYTNPATDPYSNGNGGTMLGQNQTNLDAVIGNLNYDIGHVFSTGGGGVAGLGVVGITGQKARGVTGSGSPVGDSFWIDYVAHEIGHQFGGSHTFNSSTSSCNGNRSGSSAYEPGSGSTIQSYAGICAADNLQPNSDAMFHSRSIDQIRAYIATIPAVGTTSNTGNAEPTVNAGQDYVIPTRTPFELTAIGSDPDSGNVLSYSWEQRDLGVSTTLVAADNGQSPIFRTWNPTTDPTRVFPRLSDLVNNTVPIGEKLPTVNWNSSVSGNMDFRVVVRDNASGGGGVNWDDMNIQVVNVGATGFSVTSQNAGGSWTGNSAETITWDVAGTTASPINAVNVDIWLSTDGGLTYPTLLAGATPNDGTEAITVPNIATNQARIKVKAAGNIFFDINNANIDIVEDQGDCGGDITVSITPVNRGIAVTDDATGTGYFMYSEQSLFTRFGTSTNSNTPGVFANNAQHLVAVRWNVSQWQYNTNFAWRNFTPATNDRLLAEVDFTADTVTSLQGTDSTINGIVAGYISGDLVFTPNMWDGVFNSGEFGVTGTQFTHAAGTLTANVTPVNFGIAVTDDATGTGYMMYSQQSLFTRFGTSTNSTTPGVFANNAAHLVAVRLNGVQWQYNTNFAWRDFTPVVLDRLLAEVDFTADTVTSLQGSNSTISGIQAGYVSGDVVFTPNMWNGVANSGEFGAAGTFFAYDAGNLPTNVTPVNFGIAVTDDAVGTGYFMYSQQSLFTRFGTSTNSTTPGVFANNAAHLVAVQFNGSQWQYNSNFAWRDFTPTVNDRLLASVDFSADSVTSLQGSSSTINGIKAGYVTGDIVFTPNMWNGVFNSGEFGVAGSFFDVCPA